MQYLTMREKQSLGTDRLLRPKGGGGGGGRGFLKNRVYENFTPPPPPQKKKKNFQTKVLPPTAMVGLVVELLRRSCAQLLVTLYSIQGYQNMCASR